jgi:hypothetical protein
VTDVNPAGLRPAYGRSMNTTSQPKIKLARLRKGTADVLAASLPLAMLACFVAWIAGIAGVGA